MPDLPDDLLRELLKTFQIEAAEHLQTLNQTLLKIERETDDAQRRELVQEAFRAAHSLKGAARSVDYQDIEQLAHSIETVLQGARDTDTGLEPKVCDVLYAILDGIQTLLSGQSIDTAPLYARLASIDVPIPADSAQTGSIKPELEEPVMPTHTDETIRVAVSQLDELMAQSGELLISKINAEQRVTDVRSLRQQLARWPRAWREIKTLLKHVNGESGQRLQGLLAQHFDDLQTMTRTFDAFEQALNSDALRLEMVTTDLQDDVRRVRMLPFQTIALGLERAVRDVARSEDKQIVFTITGSDTELDKKVLETLKDPLLHLLRNAVSHGIETPAEREAAGKPVKGQIKLLVRQRGSEVSLTVSDDGRGFDLVALSQAGQVDYREDGSNIDEVISLAFLPGITTAKQITTISGRGVGLDVVRQRVEAIHGRLSVHNTLGKGVAIELIVPSSMTMSRGLIIRVSSNYFALPLFSIERIVDIRDTFTIGGKQMIRLEQTSLPLLPLSAVLELAGSPNGKTTSPLAIIISVAEQRLALMVDEVLSELELAVKPLGEPLRRVRNVAGAALLGTGEPIVVLNPGDLIRSARTTRTPEQLFDTTHQEDDHASGGHVLVVDDSITTRTLEKNILEAAGYRVTIAIDGHEALRRLKENEVDLVVTDIQMPNLDGFALTRKIRETADYQHLPIILVTSLESQEDRENGMLAGADAYIVKRGFNQATLLATIQRFLESAT